MNQSSYNNKSKILGISTFIFIIILSLFLSSCGSSSNGVAGDNLEISFLSEVPPSKIYVEEGTNDIPFEVIVQISNKGGYPGNDLESLNGRLYLTGYDKAIISGAWDGGSGFTKVIGASDSYPTGGMIQKSYLASNINFPFKVNEYPMTLMLNACYHYETFASGIACIDANPTSASQNQKVCQMGGISLDTQRGPVKVTNIAQTGNSKETIFTIDISNSGNGEVLRQYTSNSGVVSDDKCLELTFGDKDVIAIDAEIVGLGAGRCSPKGTFDEPVRLFNGKGTVVCRFSLDSAVDYAYTTPLQINLRYGYLQTISKDIVLVNTGLN